MNVSQIKALCWLATVGLTGGMGWYVYDYAVHTAERNKSPDPEVVRAKLDDVPRAQAEKADLVDYERVRRVFDTFDWVGNPPPDPAAVAPVVEKEPQKASATPVSELVSVLMIQEDTTDPSNSSVYLNYLLASQVRDPRQTDRYLQTGERLKEPLDDIKIEKINALEGVTFSFDDEARAHETILPQAFKAEPIVVVDESGVRVRERNPIPTVAQAEAWRPERTHMRAKNEFVLGREDIANFGENFAEILAREVNTSRHRDPATGRYDGIQVTGVREGSTAARHGAQDGDVIKSINGEPVTSIPEAVTFVKNNAERVTRWEIVVENKGRERTMVYESPSASE